MEYLDALGSFINQAGFPVLCVIVLYVQNKRDSKRHSAERRGFVKSINNNTEAINKLCDKLDEYIGGI